MHLTHGECANICGNCSICKPLGFRVCFSDLYCEESKAFFSGAFFVFSSYVGIETIRTLLWHWKSWKSARQLTAAPNPPPGWEKRKKIIHKTNKPNCLSKRYYVIKVYYLRCENGKRRSRSCKEAKFLRWKKNYYTLICLGKTEFREMNQRAARSLKTENEKWIWFFFLFK